MAHLARLSSLTDELVTSLTGLQPRRNPKEFKQAKEIASKGLRPHQYGRVNQFDVQTRLEGLEEKFIVLDREDLAKAFKVRLDEFARIPNKFSPEFLALLLELVDNPIANSSVKALELCRPPPPEPELTWDDIVADDPLNEEGLWDDIDYGVASSEDEFDDIPITPKSSARTRRNQASEVDEDLVVIEDVTYPMDEEILQDIQKAQFWRERVPGVKGTTTHEVSELQVIREVLFMLAGLPTSLFVTSGKSISFNRNHSVNHAQLETLDNVLQHFAVIGSTLLAVRQWTSRTQTISLLQTFQAAIQHQITAVDIGLSNLQKYYLEPNRGVIASLLEIQDKVHDLTDTLIRLADLALTKSHGTAPFFYLEALFDEIDLSLLAGEAKIFRRLGDVFFQCFQTYLKPMRRWTEDGELDLHNETFFIGKTTTERQQHETSLWHDRFELRRDESGSLFAPRFLHPAAKAILNAGKSIVFLKELGLHDESATKLVEPVLDFATVCPQSTELPLTPFSELFYAAFNDWIGSKHSHAASILREQLYSRCGLWSFLDALDIVYLSEDGSMLQNLADAVFAKIDRNSSKWNDRFLLTELAQIAFGEARSVEADRIAARSRKVQKHGRTVKDLSSFSLDYQISWPLLNIIQKSSIQVYQRVFCFILQIYRSKYLLQQTITKGQGGSQHHVATELYLRQRLLWFIDILRSYLSDMVIHRLNADLRRSLQEADDIDAMAAAHSSYIADLQTQCLLDKKLSPIHQSILSILDLSVAFHDAQARKQQRTPDFSQSVRGAPAPLASKRRRRRTTTNFAISIRGHEEEDSASEDEERVNDIHDGNDGPYEGDDDDIRPQAASYGESLSKIKDKLDRLLPFVIAGLRGVSRGGATGTDAASTWELLAERLEWGSANGGRL